MMQNKFTDVMFVSFVSNVFLAFLKMISGLLFKSMALLADGAHTFSDLSTDFISISNKRRNNKVLNIIIGLSILLLGSIIIWKCNMFYGKTISMYALIISGISIISKYILSTYVLKNGVNNNDEELINNSKESDLDIISSVMVFLGLCVIQFSNDLPLLKYTDTISSIIVGLFIIYSGIMTIINSIKKSNKN